MAEREPGIDLTALLWKLVQSTQIQCTLDLTHNLYRIKKLSVTEEEEDEEETVGITTFENLDDIINRDNKYSSTSHQKNEMKKKNNNNNVYHTKILTLYEDVMKGEKTYNAVKATIRRVLIDTPLTCSDVEEKQFFATLTVNGFSNLTSFIDIRKSKKWVLYLLSDNVARIGAVQPHFIFNRIPGWLFDAVHIAWEKNLALIYATDMRGVSEWMGQLCHTINLHYMFHINLECQGKLNYTAVLIHLAGLLTEQKMNPINRQGMSFPSSVLQTTTFENVKKQLSNASGCDNLSNFISSTLMCVPRRTGTNSFNISSH